MTNKFKNTTGVRYLRGLFYETSMQKETVSYSLKDEDHAGFPSLYRLYMETNDLTEWDFANKYLDGWGHWEALCTCTWFVPYADRWRKELELRTRSAALLRLIAEAETKDGKNVFTANKFLLERGWATKAEKGRPSKDQVKRAAKEAAEENALVLEAFSLIEQSAASN